METKRRKLLILFAAAVIVIAAVVALVVLLPQRGAAELPMPTEIPVAVTPAATQTPEPTPVPTEEPPAITPPATTGSAASDSDIVLRPVVPASDSDISTTE